MSDDAYSAALNLVKDHTLLEADSVLRALVAEIERLRKIKAAAQRYIAASSDDSAPYSEEYKAWDALDEALTEAGK